MPPQVRDIDFKKLNLLRLTGSFRTLIFAKDTIFQESKQQVKNTTKKKNLHDISRESQIGESFQS